MAAKRYPEDSALDAWEFDGTACTIVRHSSLGHLCGYARFTTRPVTERGYGGVLTYVPVHGGITFAKTDADGTQVYGFDCAHAGDAVEPAFDRHGLSADGHVWTVSEVRAETERMVLFIKAIAPFEESYLAAPDNAAKAAVLDDALAQIGGVNLADNFGAALRLLCGDL